MKVIYKNDLADFILANISFNVNILNIITDRKTTQTRVFNDICGSVFKVYTKIHGLIN